MAQDFTFDVVAREDGAPRIVADGGVLVELPQDLSAEEVRELVRACVDAVGKTIRERHPAATLTTCR